MTTMEHGAGTRARGLTRGVKNVSDHERDHIERGTSEVKTATVS